MVLNVRQANNISQGPCSSGVVDCGTCGVQNEGVARRSPPPRFSPHQLKLWREHRGLTQEQLAELAGTTHATIGRYENRRIQLTQTALDNLSRALRTSRGSLLDETPPKSRK